MTTWTEEGAPEARRDTSLLLGLWEGRKERNRIDSDTSMGEGGTEEGCEDFLFFFLQREIMVFLKRLGRNWKGRRFQRSLKSVIATERKGAVTN